MRSAYVDRALGGPSGRYNEIVAVLVCIRREFRPFNRISLEESGKFPGIRHSVSNWVVAIFWFHLIPRARANSAAAR